MRCTYWGLVIADGVIDAFIPIGIRVLISGHLCIEVLHIGIQPLPNRETNSVTPPVDTSRYSAV